MDKETAKLYVKERLEDYLRGKGINTRRNFHCLNPAHNDSKPSMSIDRDSKSGPHCHCFSCGAYYDTFDLIAIDYNLTDEKDIFRKGYELYGLQIDNYTPRATAREDFKEVYQNQTKTERTTQYTIHNTQ